MRSAPVAIAAFVLALAAPLPATAQDLEPVRDRDYRDSGSADPELVELGRLLFFDKILSGNKNISCATCHHPLAATGDGISLPIGEGGNGLGVTRDTGRGGDRVHERVPRNAPTLFNLGAKEFTVMFHDGRLAVDADQPSGFLSPAGDDLPHGLDSALAAQAMFPVTSGTEMAGQRGESSVANAAARGDLARRRGVWGRLAERLQAIPEYVTRFRASFADVRSAKDIEYKHAANAIAAFEAAAWRSDNSPFDRHLRGEKGVLTRAEKRGMKLFYGEAGCSSCHSGVFQTDHDFHAIAMPQVGPGKGDGMDGRDDFGRERVSGVAADRYKFRTPSLRNVELTGPWGHGGAYATLEAVVRHHLDPVAGLYGYDAAQLVMPRRPSLDRYDLLIMQDAPSMAAISAAAELGTRQLTDSQLADLIEFLRALTDPAMMDLRHDVPLSVPSGLSLQERLPAGGSH